MQVVTTMVVEASVEAMQGSLGGHSGLVALAKGC